MRKLIATIATVAGIGMPNAEGKKQPARGDDGGRAQVLRRP
jgi:hypothetical protein